MLLWSAALAWSPVPTAPTCSASTFPLNLGNTHCPRLAKQDATSMEACMEACCAAVDACDTFQWCEAGRLCEKGFWGQPGALARGSDLDGWPRNTTIDAAEAACGLSAACIGLTYHSTEMHPPTSKTLQFYLKTKGAGYTSDTSWSRHMKASAGCYTGLLDSSCANASDGWSSHAMRPRPAGPCDIFGAAGTPCVAAHSVVRALYTNYSGPLYRVLRDSDKAALDIGTHLSGFAKASDQDAFCAGTSCYILRIFDQSPEGNNLDTSPAGGACRHPLSPVSASRELISIGGNSVYGAYFEGNMGIPRRLAPHPPSASLPPRSLPNFCLASTSLAPHPPSASLPPRFPPSASLPPPHPPPHFCLPTLSLGSTSPDRVSNRQDLGRRDR